LGLPVEIRLQILGHLLPDVDFIPFRFLRAEVDEFFPLKSPLPASCPSCGIMKEPPIKLPWGPGSEYWTRHPPPTVDKLSDLRKDGKKCQTAIMGTCQSIYRECIDLLYSRERVFEAVMNWNYAPFASLSLLSYSRINLPQATWTARHGPPPPPMLRNPEDTAPDFYKASTRITSLQLTLPMYNKIIWGCSNNDSHREHLQNLVPVLNTRREVAEDGIQLQRLHVNLLSKREHGRGAHWEQTEEESKPSHETQAKVKFAIQPFTQLKGFKPNEICFMIDGQRMLPP
jgi:hypothetical protein